MQDVFFFTLGWICAHATKSRRRKLQWCTHANFFPFTANALAFTIMYLSIENKWPSMWRMRGNDGMTLEEPWRQTKENKYVKRIHFQSWNYLTHNGRTPDHLKHYPLAFDILYTDDPSVEGRVVYPHASHSTHGPLARTYTFHVVLYFVGRGCCRSFQLPSSIQLKPDISPGVLLITSIHCRCTNA